MEIKNKNILILSPHTDDETLGCGGLIHKLSHNNKINIICFSYCGKEKLKDEFTRACNSLCKDPYLDILEFKVREFDRQKVLDELIELKKEINPDIIICPSSFDVHQDHLTVYNECVRAFKDKCILGYCHPWNIVGKSDLRLTVKLTATDIFKKEIAMDYYKSQYHREYFQNRKWIDNKEKLEIIIWNS